MKKLLITAAIALVINAKSQDTLHVHVKKVYRTNTDVYATTREGFVLNRHWNGEKWLYWERVQYSRKLVRLVNSKGHKEGWHGGYYFSTINH